ncbi:hypothetical protein DFH09DRAFT_1161403 [Mycena vulgaris]|nr:hypothetical protein DFH09DRAFT_1161403 [Mycena vulgaris]
MQIKSLRLKHTSNIEDWLLLPSSPFDFTHLVDFETAHDTGSSALVQLLTATRMSITGLRIYGRSVFEINLSQFPALKSLDIHFATYPVILRLNPENAIEILVLTVPSYTISGASHSMRELFSEMDAAVATSPLPALQQVLVRVLRLSPSDPEVDLELVKGYFQQLEARDLLVVTSHKY